MARSRSMPVSRGGSGRVSKWDYLFLFMLLVLFVVWNLNRHNETYHNMIVAIKHKQSGKEMPDIDPVESQAEPEEEEPDEEKEMQKKLEQQKRREKREKEEMELRQKAVKERKQEQFLNRKSEVLREKYEHGVDLDKLEREMQVDEDEEQQMLKAFEAQIQEQVEEWSRDADAIGQVQEIRKSKDSLTTEDEDLLRLADKQRKWVQDELESMVQSVRKKVGSKLPPMFHVPVDDIVVRSSSSQSGGGITDGSSLGGADHVNGGDGGASVAVAHPNTGSSEKHSYHDLLAKIRASVTPFGAGDKKMVLVLGEKNYISRDLAAYMYSFGNAGFTVKRRKPELGHMTIKSFLLGDWKVLICLALDTSSCFNTHSMPKTHRNQRINRLMGLRQVLWSKDSFCNTLANGIQGNRMFSNHTFDCWTFPKGYSQAALHAEENPESSYIVKPISMGGGMGIHVVDGAKGLYKIRHKTQIVQTYLPNPMLINGRKWDIRTYVLVTSSVPIRAYLYTRGLIRFASALYDANAKKGGKRSQFLTNTSVNKHYVRKGNVTSITWSFKSLENHFDENNLDYGALMHRMEAAISMVFLSAELGFKSYFNALKSKEGSIKYCSNCYQVMGVDLIVDSNFHPRVIEVNGQPSMQLTKDASDHYTSTKRAMLKDMTAVVYNEEDVVDDVSEALQQVSDSDIGELSAKEFEYVLEYAREGRHLGGFRSVYPNSYHYELHTEFLKSHNLPASRMALHRVLNELDVRFRKSGLIVDNSRPTGNE